MIKKSVSLCALLFILISLVAEAQIHQYSVLAGGNIIGRYWRGTLPSNVPGGGDVKFSNIEIDVSPRGGVFLWQQFALGLGVDYQYANRLYKENELEPREDEKEVEWTAGPFARYVFPNRLFLEGFLGLGLRNIDDQERTDVLRTTLGAGYALFLNDKVALEPMIKYAHYSREITQSIREKRNGVELSVGLQVYLYHDKIILFR